jgi:tetratricopeptide (TPR) repeat protein
MTSAKPVRHVLGVLAVGAVLLSATAAWGAPACPPAAPEADSQQEIADYDAAGAPGVAGEAMRAADNFAARYPKSALRALLYRRVISLYIGENSIAGIIEAGEKALAADPDELASLVTTAQALADQMPDGAVGDPRIKIVRARTAKALQIMDRCSGSATGQPAANRFLTATVYSAQGTVALKARQYAEAERAFALSLKTQPDEPYVHYHLALAQDHLGEYPAALASARRAEALSGGRADLKAVLAPEIARLTRLAGR